MTCSHTPVEIKTFGQLIDDFVTCSQRIWHLVDRVNAGDQDPGLAVTVQQLNNKRHELMRALDRKVGDADLGPKVFESQAVIHGDAPQETDAV